MAAAGDCQAIGASREVARIDLLAVQIFDASQPEPRQILDERRWIEEQLKGFTGASHPRRHRIQRQLLRRAQKRRSIAKSNTTPLPEGILAMNWMVASNAGRERYGVTPSQEKNAGCCFSKPAVSNPSSSDCRFKIHRRECHFRRDRDAGGI